MRIVNGYALFLSLMLILMLSVFAFWLLLMSEAHYAASRALFEGDNARIISDAALQYLVQLHNHQQPRFFTDPYRWNQLQLKPFWWNQYQISGALNASWNASQPNAFTLRADKGRYASELQATVRQLRLEDFALFSNSSQTIATSTLFDGAVYMPSLTLNKSCRFRECVFNEVSPSYYASYRRKSTTYLDFSAITDLFPAGWNAGSILIQSKNPLFWQTDHYSFDLDALDVSAVGKKWRIFYQGKSIGDATFPGIIFDDRVQVHQTYREMSWLSTGKPDLSFYVSATGDFIFKSSVQTLQGQSLALRLCFVTSKNISISPDSTATRMNATLVAIGDIEADTGSAVLDPIQKKSWQSEIRGSAFLIEPVLNTDLLAALNNGEKILWFRGTVAFMGDFHGSADLKNIHYEATRKIHSALGSFPYTEIVEGGEQWQ